jgi:2-polyprenyl-6-methoxyphenol hydroxylase-like FAD-dependent oxidoreductase
MQYTEICIVGGGPGGACAALALAELGIPCVLLDKAVFPRDKVGGDVLPGIILRALHEIRPGLVPKFANHPRLMEIKGTELFAPNGRKITVDYRNISIGEFEDTVSCFSAPRKVFDELLIEQVRAAPLIRFEEGRPVHRVSRTKDGLILTDKPGSFAIHTKLLIVANGAGSSLSRQLTGFKVSARHRGVGLRAYFRQVDFPDHPRYARLFFTEDILPGIFYMTP